MFAAKSWSAARTSEGEGTTAAMDSTRTHGDMRVARMTFLLAPRLDGVTAAILAAKVLLCGRYSRSCDHVKGPRVHREGPHQPSLACCCITAKVTDYRFHDLR